MCNANWITILTMAFLVGFVESRPISSTPVKPLAVDTVFMHGLYVDGDFDKATKDFETALKKSNLTHSDSVFIFKHLGVMYAAREETRERGKYFLYKLVTAEPEANILDMYASDLIYAIFKNLKDEYLTSQSRLNNSKKPNSETVKNPEAVYKDTVKVGTLNNQKKKPVIAETKSSSTMYWVSGIGLATLIGVGTFYYFDNQTPTKKSYAF